MQSDQSAGADSSARREFLKGAGAVGAAVALGGVMSAVSGAAAAATVKQGSFVTRDRVRLNYLEAGRGRPLLLIPGWSQTAAMYEAQLAALSDRHRVIALDMRGHGDYDKPAHGYRIARLATDVHEFLLGMDLRDVAIAGHSMGCSVIWSYWDLFGRERITRMVLIDQAPTVNVQNGWSDEQKAEAGALFTPQALYDTAAALAGPDGVKTTEGLVNELFFTKSYPRDRLAWVLAQNLKFPREYGARLLVDHCTQDWRDTIRTIDVPTVVFGGEASFFTPRSQRWVAQQIPGALVHIFGAEEGGGHFMFMENPAKFNRLLAEFLS